MTASLETELAGRRAWPASFGTVVAHLARIALGGVMLFAGLLKAADVTLFVEQIQAYAILPPDLAPAAARLFVAVELGLALSLLAGWRPRLALPAAAALLVLFMSAIGWAWAHGYSGPCGCFGSRGSKGPGGALLEDTLFLALAGIGYQGLRHARGDRPWQRAAAAAGLLLGVVLPIVAARLPLDGVVTDGRPGVPFDHIVVEGYDGDVRDGDYLLALLDPRAESSAAAVPALNELAEGGGLPAVVAILEGANDDLVGFMFEHDPIFEMGHAPHAAMRRFYRTLPVFLRVRDGVIREAWHGAMPGAEALRAAPRH